MHIWTGGMNPDYKPPARAATPASAARRTTATAACGWPAADSTPRDDMYTQPQFGDMFSNLTASYDPIFWPIHANIDRLWWEWQQMNPQALPRRPGRRAHAVELHHRATRWTSRASATST